MDYAISPHGLLVHDRNEWPCSSCRPDRVLESRGICLCVRCAHGIVAAAGAGAEGARDLLDDVTDALAILEACVLEKRVAAN